VIGDRGRGVEGGARRSGGGRAASNPRPAGGARGRVRLPGGNLVQKRNVSRGSCTEGRKKGRRRKTRRVRGPRAKGVPKPKKPKQTKNGRSWSRPPRSFKKRATRGRSSVSGGRLRREYECQEGDWIFVYLQLRTNRRDGTLEN